MSVTFTLQEALIAIVLIAVFVFLIYLIQLIKKLTITLTRTNRILKNVESVSDIVEHRATDMDSIVDSAATSMRAISGAMRSEESMIKQMSVLVRGFSTLIGMFKR